PLSELHSLSLIFAVAILIEFLWEIRTCANSKRISREFISNRVFSPFFLHECPFPVKDRSQRAKAADVHKPNICATGQACSGCKDKADPSPKALRDDNEKLEAGPCLRQAGLAECARD